MREYTPDCWKVIEIKYDANSEIHYRVAAGWYGGFTQGDSWKINSGIVDTVQEGDIISFTGDTGSVYRCHVRSEGLNGYTTAVVKSYNIDHEKIGGYVREVDFRDFEKLTRA